MKRAAPLELEGWNRAELLELGYRVKERLSEEGWLVTREFFGCGDIFRDEVLSRVTREISFKELKSLRLVCKQWSKIVMQVEHLSFGANGWSSSLYSLFLGKHFNRVTSVKAHAKILTDCHTDEYGGFARIKRLEILPLGSYERLPNDMQVSRCLALETLVLPQHNFDYEIKDMDHLTTLTSLTCNAYVFQEIDELFALTNLTTLSISGLSLYAQPAEEFPKLTHLESDFPGHFIGFTGTGLLETFDFEGTDVEEERVFSDKQHDLCLKGAMEITMDGKWERGIFTGNASIQYEVGDRELILRGLMIDGKFHGTHIQEISHENRALYRGEFKRGVKDGLGITYHWEGLRYWDEKNLKPFSIEYWVNGVKKDELFF